MVLVNESPDQVASVRLNPGLKGKLTTTTFQVVEGTSTITQTPVASLAGSLKLSPYSVNLVRVVQG